MAKFFERWFGKGSAVGPSRTLPKPVKPWLSLADEADFWIRNALEHGPSGQKIGNISPWRALNLLESRKLLDIERAFRDFGWEADSAAMRRVLAAASTVSEPDQAAAYRFAASCAADGFVRQETLGELIQMTRLDLAAAMIRTQDWVPQVRAAANEALLEIFWSPDPVVLFGVFDLYLLLQRRQRGGTESWHEVFQSQLMGENYTSLRWGLTSHPEADVRKAAFDLVLRVDKMARPDALRLAVGDRACWIALWALAEVHSPGDEAIRDELLASAARHRHPAVRAQALREREELQPDPAHLQWLVLDRSRSVRNAAVYLLKTKYGQSALPIWREIVDGADAEFPIAASALAEHAEPSDEKRLEGLLAHRAARLRSMAMHALTRLDGDDLATHLDRALDDSSPRVLREVVRGYFTRSQSLSPERLHEVFAAATTLSSRVALLGAARVLGKWQELAFLASQAQNADAEFFEFFRPHLNRWFWHANSSYVSLTEERRNELLEMLGVACVAHPSYSWHRLREMV